MTLRVEVTTILPCTLVEASEQVRRPRLMEHVSWPLTQGNRMVFREETPMIPIRNGGFQPASFRSTRRLSFGVFSFRTRFSAM